MPEAPYLHEHAQFGDLLRIVADEKGVLPSLVEKDYWVMHALRGLQDLGWTFELKGGTSLSKGFDLIHRFSEDLDLRIDPEIYGIDVPVGRNQTKTKHVEARRAFYDWLTENLHVPGIVSVSRDPAFDDRYLRSAGIRLNYDSEFAAHPDLKEGVLLEVGFDQTRPAIDRTLSSWALDRAREAETKFCDNRAINVACYHPGYTLVEKLQAISTKYRRYLATRHPPANFIRHYYDIRHLLDDDLVMTFAATEDYQKHKRERFGGEDDPNLMSNPAFLLKDHAIRAAFAAAFEEKSDFYFGNSESFDEIIGHIQEHLQRL